VCEDVARTNRHGLQAQFGCLPNKTPSTAKASKHELRIASRSACLPAKTRRNLGMVAPTRLEACLRNQRNGLVGHGAAANNVTTKLYLVACLTSGAGECVCNAARVEGWWDLRFISAAAWHPETPLAGCRQPANSCSRRIITACRHLQGATG
jgi:hypothetical protein